MDRDARGCQGLGRDRGGALLKRGFGIERDVLGDHVRAGRGQVVQRLHVPDDATISAVEEQRSPWSQVVNDLEHRRTFVAIPPIQHIDAGRHVAERLGLIETVHAIRDHADFYTGAGEAQVVRADGVVQDGPLAHIAARVRRVLLGRAHGRHPRQRRGGSNPVRRNSHGDDAEIRRRCDADGPSDICRRTKNRGAEASERVRVAVVDPRLGMELHFELAACGHPQQRIRQFLGRLRNGHPTGPRRLETRDALADDICDFRGRTFPRLRERHGSAVVRKRPRQQRESRERQRQPTDECSILHAVLLAPPATTRQIGVIGRIEIREENPPRRRQRAEGRLAEVGLKGPRAVDWCAREGRYCGRASAETSEAGSRSIQRHSRAYP